MMTKQRIMIIGVALAISGTIWLFGSDISVLARGCPPCILQ